MRFKTTKKMWRALPHRNSSRVRTKGETVKIDITQELIESATRKDSMHCMIADAIQQQYDVHHVIVDVQSIRFSRRGKDKRYTYLTPRLAQKQILAFDRGEPIEPWS